MIKLTLTSSSDSRSAYLLEEVELELELDDDFGGSATWLSTSVPPPLSPPECESSSMSSNREANDDLVPLLLVKDGAVVQILPVSAHRDFHLATFYHPKKKKKTRIFQSEQDK